MIDDCDYDSLYIKDVSSTTKFYFLKPTYGNCYFIVYIYEYQLIFYRYINSESNLILFYEAISKGECQC